MGLKLGRRWIDDPRPFRGPLPQSIAPSLFTNSQTFFTPETSIIIGIKSDYGALSYTEVPNPATNFGGSRLWSLPDNGTVFAAIHANSAPGQMTVNFGATAFGTTPPSGFSAWGSGATLDPATATMTLSGGNLTGTAVGRARSTTSKATGKWYFEVTINALGGSASNQAIGVWNGVGSPSFFGNDGNSFACFDDGNVNFGLYYPAPVVPGGVYVVESQTKDILDAVFAASDVIGVAVDLDNRKMWFRRNGGAWKCLGTTQAWAEFKKFGQLFGLNPIVLDLESIDMVVYDFNAHLPFAGIRRIDVLGTGATFRVTATGPGASGYDLGSHSGFNSSFFGATTSLSVRLEAVSPGATVLTTRTGVFGDPLSDATGFMAAGDWCCLSALEMQGHAGYPPNLHFCEYVQVAAITPTQVTLTAPVVGSYATHYPDRNSALDGYDPGGPASLHKMERSGSLTPTTNSWDLELSITGLTLFVDPANPGAGNAMNIACRTLDLINTTWTNTSPNLSVTKTVNIQGGSISNGFVEIDKVVELMTFTGVTLTNTIQYQSSSIGAAIFSNCTFGTNFHSGARVSTQISNSSIAGELRFAQGYGACGPLYLANVSVTTVGIPAPNFIELTDLTYSNGTFTSSPHAVITLATPGKGWLGTQSRTFGIGFRITDIQVDGSNRTLIVTDLPYATLPAIPTGLIGPWRFYRSYAEAIYFTNCTGHAHVVEWSEAAAQGRQPYNYIHRTLGPSTSNPGSGSVYGLDTLGGSLIGHMVSVTINVIRAYTGAQPNALFAFDFAGLGFPAGESTPPFESIRSNRFDAPNSVGINAKIAGVRTITPSEVTGAQSGDTFAATAAGVPTSFPKKLAFEEAVGTGLFAALSGALLDMSGDTLAQTPIIEVTVISTSNSQFS